MKYFLASLLSIIFVSNFSFAGSIQFPGEGLTLIVYKDHFTIYGPETPNLPLQAHNDDSVTEYVLCGTGKGPCFALTCSTIEPVETAIRNAWIALLLKTSTTGEPVTVHWSESSSHGQTYGIGNCGKGGGYGNIYAVETK